MLRRRRCWRRSRRSHHPRPVAVNTPPSAASTSGSNAVQPGVSSRRYCPFTASAGRLRVIASAASNAITQATASPTRVAEPLPIQPVDRNLYFLRCKIDQREHDGHYRNQQRRKEQSIAQAAARMRAFFECALGKLGDASSARAPQARRRARSRELHGHRVAFFARPVQNRRQRAASQVRPRMRPRAQWRHAGSSTRWRRRTLRATSRHIQSAASRFPSVRHSFQPALERHDPIRMDHERGYRGRQRPQRDLQRVPA